MHTLNELVTVIPVGDYADMFESLLSAIVQMTGWERSESTIYMDSAHKFKLVFSYAGGSANSFTVSTYYNDSLQLGNSVSLNLNAVVTIRVHKSTNESVTYLCISSNTNATFAYALNSKGDGVLFKYGSAGNIYVGTKSLTGSGTNVNSFITPKTANSYKTFAAAKFADLWNTDGGEFQELYYVYGATAVSVQNQLVNFNGKVMRLFSPSYSADYMNFAMPVSDEEEN